MTSSRAMQIVATMFWRRLDLPGHDACRLEKHGNGWQLDGAAVFRNEDGRPARLDYRVHCDNAWHAQWGRVRGWVGSAAVDFAIARGGNGEWSFNDQVVPGLAHCTDLDLGFTPATNLVQLRRLQPQARRERRGAGRLARPRWRQPRPADADLRAARGATSTGTSRRASTTRACWWSRRRASSRSIRRSGPPKTEALVEQGRVARHQCPVALPVERDLAREGLDAAHGRQVVAPRASRSRSACLPARG